ncbi:flagellar basal body rod protein FlgB [Stagnimonas aquatica]|uniref:Flagellar basal body rod protein FlgB n=1 Tax=Stagnimonas aquatica TaxID=2689987 RepID=A0A3N0V5J9_9GAMM|nr:flagellar basal body rod protein FlgB [Stagnimonas aquatica]ROH87854.1 flagellar basal body rod protein FlgB [Stagnimonas aquatica]
MSDPLFGVHAAALTLGRQRMDVLASNLANADTPHYQAKDIDFERALAAQTAVADAERLSGSDARHLSTPGEGGEAETVWRVPLQPSADGNTVDAQIEQAQFADAALRYQASLNFLDGRVRSLMTAITGQSA